MREKPAKRSGKATAGFLCTSDAPPNSLMRRDGHGYHILGPIRWERRALVLVLRVTTQPLLH
jgi:hypothetical protein